MRDVKNFSAGGDATESLIRALHQVPRRRNAQRLSLLVLLYGCLVLLIVRGDVRWAFLSVPLMAVILAGLLNAAHDCVHLRFTGNRGVDAGLGQWLCAPLLINFRGFRTSHLAHHRHARGKGDTEWTGHFNSRWHYLRYLLLANPLRGQLIVWRLRGEEQQEGNRSVQLCQLSLLTLIVIFPVDAALCWAMPFVLGHVLVRFFSLPEHYGLAVHPQVGGMTRSVRSLAALRFLLWEASFHAEHHRWPGVPSLNLPALHRLGAMALPHLCTGYLRFHYELYVSLRRYER